MRTQIIDWKMAKLFNAENHRHNPNLTGHKFSIGLFVDDLLVGVAVCGRPVGRYLDNGKNLEVYRCCTNGTRNACSKLYAACIKEAKKRGIEKVYTYTLHSETGASVKASNFILDCEKAGKPRWNGRTEFKGIAEYKRRWIYII